MSLIPKNIFQSWKTKNLSNEMKNVVDNTKKMNPEYVYELWDDKDCRQFLLDNFGINYANAFDTLIPGAFKCDFWRYAVLYIHGGVYMDLDMIPLIPFREMIKPTDRFLSIVDRDNGFNSNIRIPGIFQSFIACEPKHPIIKYALDLTFSNIVGRKTSTLTSLDISGPTVMLNAVNLYFKNPDTFALIKVGNYPDGVRFFIMSGDYTTDKDGNKLFKNKMDDYKPEVYYGNMKKYYKMDVDRFVHIPERKTKIILFCIFLSILIFFICRKKLNS